MLVYCRLGASRATAATPSSDVASAPGFLDRARDHRAVRRAAAAATSSDFGCYLGLAAFKLAAILEGIHYRYLHGQTVGAGFDRIGDVDPPAAGRAASPH